MKDVDFGDIRRETIRKIAEDRFESAASSLQSSDVEDFLRALEVAKAAEVTKEDFVKKFDFKFPREIEEFRTLARIYSDIASELKRRQAAPPPRRPVQAPVVHSYVGRAVAVDVDEEAEVEPVSLHVAKDAYSPYAAAAKASANAAVSAPRGAAFDPEIDRSMANLHSIRQRLGYMQGISDHLEAAAASAKRLEKLRMLDEEAERG
eukprot:TRINITY_DN24345_c0_g1_i2.p1 TRINITY_DN24345_c0_g1~~TRINITY_DN24345_c0_g1_i2.p1  ORF type:complete len:206 (-),score=71.04 TRINITY_DN24345_c0_g1_i2:514-1131(-)